MRVRHATVLATACAVALFGCSLLVSVDGLSGGAEPIDGATEAASNGDAAFVDSGAAESDGPPSPSEAGVEAGPVDFCAGTVFCDRFERSDVQGSWGSAFADNGGTLAIDNTTFASASRSLAVHVPAAGAPHAQLGSPPFAGVDHVRVAFSMKTAAPDREMSLMRLQLSEADRYAVFDLFMLGNGIVAAEQGSGPGNAGYFQYPVSGFIAGKWQQWTLELDARGPSAIGIVTVDGAEVRRETLRNTYRKSSFGVLLGVYYTPDGAAPRDVAYDDVSFTILP